jgi:hypothetical protein
MDAKELSEQIKSEVSSEDVKVETGKRQSFS